MGQQSLDAGSSIRGAGTAPAGPASAGPIIAIFFLKNFFFFTHQAVKMSVPEKFHPSKSYVFPVCKFGSKGGAISTTG